MSTTPPIDKLAAGPTVREDNLVNDPVTAIPTAAANPQIVREAAVSTGDETAPRRAAPMTIKIDGATMLTGSISLSLVHGIGAMATAGVLLGVSRANGWGTTGALWHAATDLGSEVLLGGLRLISQVTAGERR